MKKEPPHVFLAPLGRSRAGPEQNLRVLGAGLNRMGN